MSSYPEIQHDDDESEIKSQEDDAIQIEQDVPNSDVKIISILNFNPSSEIEPLLNSPRSLQAC